MSRLLLLVGLREYCHKQATMGWVSSEALFEYDFSIITFFIIINGHLAARYNLFAYEDSATATDNFFFFELERRMILSIK